MDQLIRYPRYEPQVAIPRTRAVTGRERAEALHEWHNLPTAQDLSKMCGPVPLRIETQVREGPLTLTKTLIALSGPMTEPIG